jgi:hypothetical protein
LPYVYINESEDEILPIQDSDTGRMTVLIPTLLADVNYASMFQAFAIIYGINVKFQELKKDPSVFWAFETEPGSEAKPEIGTIKPDMDVEGSLNLIASQLAFWLNSLGLKSGAVGDINGTNFASGIAKMIDEADTVQDRKEQVPYFEAAEQQLWDLVLKKMHPYWAANNLIENNTIFSPTTKITISYPEQIPMTKRKELVDEQVVELNNKLTTRDRSIKRINPEMTDEQVKALIVEIESQQPAAEPPTEDKGNEETEDDEDAA